MTEILPKLELPKLSRSVLIAFRSADLTAEKLGRIVDTNPRYLDALTRRWLSLSRAQDAASRTEFLLVQLGMESARDFLIALQAVRSVTGKHAAWSEDGKLALEPASVLRHALKAEKHASLIPGENPAIAYAAGLLFDLLELMPAPQETRKFSAAQFEQGLKAAQLASALGRRLAEPRLGRYLFGGALLASAGKAMLAHLAPDFARFDARCFEKALPRVVSEFAVKKRFGLTPALLSSQACRAMGVFEKTERALLFCEQPYLLRSDPKPVYQLAAAIRLALNIAREPKRIERDDDPELARWKGLELRELPIDASELAELSRKI